MSIDRDNEGTARPAPGGLSDGDRAVVKRLSDGSTRTFPAGHDITREGERSTDAMLIRAGWACRYRLLDNGRRQITAVCLPGDLCNFDAAMTGRAGDFLMAVTPVEMFCLRGVKTLFDRASHAERATLLHHHFIACATQAELLVSLGQRTAVERVAHFLFETFLRLDGVGLARGDTCAFPLKQTDLGDILGLTSVHVNRMIRQLRETGLIGIAGGRLVLHDKAAIRTTARMNPHYFDLLAPAGYGHAGTA